MSVSESYNIDQLVASLKDGDRQAFNDLYWRYATEVGRIALKYFKSKELSEEIVQEVFIRVWENRANLDEHASFQNYLYTITKNLVLNKVRKFFNERKYLSYLGKQIDLSHNKTEDAVIYSDLEKFSTNLINSLPPQRKRIFKMSREEKMSNQEIANSLGLSKRTVENHITRAIKYMKGYLKTHAEISSVIVPFITSLLK